MIINLMHSKKIYTEASACYMHMHTQQKTVALCNFSGRRRKKKGQGKVGTGILNTSLHYFYENVFDPKTILTLLPFIKLFFSVIIIVP